jgi:predicted Zn-dependent protease
MAMSRTAHYLDGRSAIRQRVSVEATSKGLRIITGTGEAKMWSYDRIRQTQGTYAGEPVRLEYGDEPAETVIVSSATFLKEIHQAAAGLSRQFHDPGRRTARKYGTVVAAATVIVLTAVLYRSGIPGFAELVTPYIPLSWEDALGQQVIEHLAPKEHQCRDRERMAQLERVIHVLSSTAAASPYQIRLYVVDNPSINAFAVPGGHIVLLRGLLELTDSPEQLAGVLAHELQHVYRRHTTRAIVEQTASSLLLTALSGDLSGGIAWGLEGVRTIGALRYSRLHETEADAEGIKMMQAANIDSTAMTAFYGTIQRTATGDRSEGFDFLATHPNMAERVSALQVLSTAHRGPMTSILPGADWKDVRSLCRLQHNQLSASS